MGKRYPSPLQDMPTSLLPMSLEEAAEDEKEEEDLLQPKVVVVVIAVAVMAQELELKRRISSGCTSTFGDVKP
jgi:hypothetical protein